MGTYAVAVDVGGTFTDIVLCDLESNAQQVYKTPSTPDDPSLGFMTGLAQILAASGVTPAEVVHIFHGTTIATNSVLENKGAPVGLLVTDGFKYVLEIARHGTPRLANPNTWVKPERPVRPRDCLEVAERTSFEGQILVPLDEPAVRDGARHFQRAGVSTVAIAFLHSYANPTNERRAREILLQELPNVAVSLSSEVLPVYREYERTITTVLNAYVTPRVSTYIDNLKQSLRSFGTDAAFSIMKSNGGIIGADVAVEQPVYTALSGPAAGVMATLQIAESTGVQDCISFDMGGTSTDVSLIKQREPTVTLNGKLGDWPIQLPMLDIATIGCGGGSIAEVSPYGSLTVGPASAGADPGPACYGRGSTRPTVTDANLVLGRVNTQIAVWNGATTPGTSRWWPMAAPGPMHAIDVANMLGIEKVVVPPHPGIASAYGLLVAKFKNDYAKTFLQQPPDYDLDGMDTVWSELEAQGRAWLHREGVPVNSHSITRSADLRYAHQGSELTLQYSHSRVNREGLESILQDFHQQHEQLYGFALEQQVEIVTLRVTASGQVGNITLPRIPGWSARADQAIIERREVYFEESRGFVPCAIYPRDSLKPGAKLMGPAILEGMDSTVVINPGWETQVDEYGNCIMRAQGNRR
ncbi:Putative D-/L-hydantoinase subunit A [Geodia barretti]|uniref:D-/L-hydantoinase subunit A n=1 Tax=Geodia barretti TaxID=519541 RepID=A0AA35RKD4_GEOBA|nr:Putative D-/L-hydantoinase subunit A [Geodia barretti]